MIALSAIFQMKQLVIDENYKHKEWREPKLLDLLSLTGNNLTSKEITTMVLK